MKYCTSYPVNSILYTFQNILHYNKQYIICIYRYITHTETSENLFEIIISIFPVSQFKQKMIYKQVLLLNFF